MGLNPTTDNTRHAHAHANWMGGPSWDLSDPVARLRMAAASCFFGEPMYYHRDEKSRWGDSYLRGWGLSDRDVKHLADMLDRVDPVEWRGLNPAQLMERAIDAALDHDAEATLATAAMLRNEDNIRATPQVILVRAAHHPKVRGTSLITTFAPSIIKRADEPAMGLAYQIDRYGARGIPNSLKRGWKRYLESLDDYQVAKYLTGARAVKMVDVINLVHPASEACSTAIKGEAKLSGRTWESLISEKGSNKATWTEAVGKMGHMALLRNLRNLHKNDVPSSVWADRLLDGVEKGKQLPFRYYSAYKALKAESVPGVVLDVVEACLDRSLANTPQFPGRVMSLCDNSGSAWGTMTSSLGSMHIAEIANLTAVITAMVSEEGHIGVFGDNLKTLPIRKRSSIFDQVDAATRAGHGIGAGTEHGIWLFWRDAIAQKQHWDHVFVYSDMQAGHGGLYGHAGEYRDYLWGGRGSHYIDVPKLINEYRSKVNPNVNVYLVQVAGYQDTIVPETYNRTYILGGWGDGILRYAARMAQLQAPTAQG